MAGVRGVRLRTQIYRTQPTNKVSTLVEPQAGSLLRLLNQRWQAELILPNVHRPGLRLTRHFDPPDSEKRLRHVDPPDHSRKLGHQVVRQAEIPDREQPPRVVQLNNRQRLRQDVPHRNARQVDPPDGK